MESHPAEAYVGVMKSILQCIGIADGPKVKFRLSTVSPTPFFSKPAPSSTRVVVEDSREDLPGAGLNRSPFDEIRPIVISKPGLRSPFMTNKSVGSEVRMRMFE